METVGWATSAVAGLGGCVLVLGYLLDQVPALADKAAAAVEALHRLRGTWRGDYESDVGDESDTIDSCQSDGQASSKDDEDADQSADRNAPDA